MDDMWGNVLLAAAIGYGLIAAAALGSVLGQSTAGRRALRKAPMLLGGLLIAYVAVALLLTTTGKPRQENCVYSSEHPSNCAH
ncbi:MAG: hypothetical protein ACOY4R_00870 [Pseudomonadota bacterium]